MISGLQKHLLRMNQYLSSLRDLLNRRLWIFLKVINEVYHFHAKKHQILHQKKTSMFIKWEILTVSDCVSLQ